MMFQMRVVTAASLLGFTLLTSHSFAASWDWQHPGIHGGNGMLDVTIQTRKNVDWAPNNWKGECSGTVKGRDPVGTALFQGFANGLNSGSVFTKSYFYANAILCTNADKMNGLGWTIDKFNYVVLDAYDHDDQRGSWQAYGDWAPGSYKAECPDGYAVTGFAQTPTGNSDVTKVLCSKISVRHPSYCRTAIGDEFGSSVAELYDDYTLNGQDWNYGYTKQSCPADTYVAGIGMTAWYSPAMHTPGALLCCYD